MKFYIILIFWVFGVNAVAASESEIKYTCDISKAQSSNPYSYSNKLLIDDLVVSNKDPKRISDPHHPHPLLRVDLTEYGVPGWLEFTLAGKGMAIDFINNENPQFPSLNGHYLAVHSLPEEVNLTFGIYQSWDMLALACKRLLPL